VSFSLQFNTVYSHEMNENMVRKAQKFKAMANKEIQISEWVIRKDLADKEFPLR
jgi:hypothetical protein